MGLAVLALCIFAVPHIARGAAIEIPAAAPYKNIAMIGTYITALLFFIGLSRGIKLLNYIDKNQAFSALSAKALAQIMYCAIGIGIIYTLNLPLFYMFAQQDDAPGVVVLGMMIAAAPFVVAVFAAVLQKLVRSAIAIKSENDLTV